MDNPLYTDVGSCDEAGVRVLFALPGLHRVDRGAEVAFLSVATELSKMGHEITLIGSGPQLQGRPYTFLQAKCVAREKFEHFPKLPFLRTETAWEELTFTPGLFRAYAPKSYDATVTCAFPFTNLLLRRRGTGAQRPTHIFVTQNGDWPAYSDEAEFRLFDCDGLVCTNPDYYERNKERYRSTLIPNGVDLGRFAPGPAVRQKFELPTSGRLVLMVSALIASKNVHVAIEAVSRIPDSMLVVAGDGPLRTEMAALAESKMPGRYRQMRVSPSDMPDLYRSADVFLHLSRDESFGNVFVEALAVGTPVVAYNLPRTRWIVGDCAFLASDETSSGLIEQIELASHATSEARARAVTHAVHFSWGEVARQYAEFIEKVVAARREAAVEGQA